MRNSVKINLVDPIWEKQVGETTFAYSIFLKYKEEKTVHCGTMASLQRRMGRKPNFVKQLTIYSCVHRWRERIDAYLNHLNQIELEEQEIARREMVRRQADNGMKFQTKAMEMLEKLTANLDADDVCRLIETGVKMERIARGAPSEITASAVPDKLETREERMARLKSQIEDING